MKDRVILSISISICDTFHLHCIKKFSPEKITGKRTSLTAFFQVTEVINFRAKINVESFSRNLSKCDSSISPFTLIFIQI